MYAASDLIGSPGEMYDRMVKYAEAVPVSGNRGGSYLTMWSLQGIKFGILQVFRQFLQSLSDVPESSPSLFACEKAQQ